MKNDTAPDLAFFVLLAKLGSMTATARELGVTPPAITKRLSLMEQKLGVRLVNRTTRRISLTNEGSRIWRNRRRSCIRYARWRKPFPAAAPRPRDCCA